MKTFNISFDESGEILSYSDSFAVEGDSGCVRIYPTFPDVYAGYTTHRRAYIACANGTTDLINLSVSDDKEYIDLTSVHTAAGTLHITFELSNGTIYVKFEKFSIYVNPAVRLNPSIGSNPYTVTVDVCETVVTGEPGTAAAVENIGNTKDAVFKFTIPKGEKGYSPVRGVDYWTKEDQAAIDADLNDKLANKADKQTANGGFEGGNGASAGGGGALGANAKAIHGGAVGYNANTTFGGSVGLGAYSEYGGSVGASAKTSDGFAGGKSAQAVDSDGNAIDAIQLGMGTNSEEKTAQFYDYKIMKSDGNIPVERLTELKKLSVPHTTASGYPVSVSDHLEGERVIDYKVYGNSVQDGTPAPDNPIEIQSVGDLVTDTSSPYYGKYDVPVTVCGKNLFDKSISNQDGIKNETILPNDRYGLTILPTNKICDILEPNTTYTISCEYECTAIPESEYVYNNGALGFIIKQYSSGYSDINIYINKQLSAGEIYKYSKTFTTPSKFDNGGKYELLCYMNKYINSDNKINTASVIVRNLQIELGTISTPYEPYSEETKHIYLDAPLRKVGDYADYVDFEKQKVVRQINDIRFNQTSYWTTVSGKENLIITSIDNSHIGSGYPCISNISGFKVEKYSDSNYTGLTSWSSVGNALMWREDGITPDTFKERLATTPMTVYYIRATPTEKPITVPELTSPNSAVMNVSSETATQPSQIDLTYYQDINKVITNLTNAILAQGGNV